MERKNITYSTSTLEIIAIVLIILKVLGLIDTPWIWVLAPIWIPLCCLCIILIVIGILYFIKEIIL